jgi:EmrB/QacA subfamily drug resistance transporter
MSTAVLDAPVLVASPSTVTITQAEPVRRRWLGLLAVLAAMIMNLLDSTVVNIAGPAIRADLGGGYSSLQWIAAGYTLALTVGLLAGGRLGDMYGRKRVLLVGIAGFVLASLACAAAWSQPSLLGARVLQGLFGAIMIPQGFGLIRDMFPPKEIGKAFGAFGPIIGLSTVLGPIVAGALVAAAGWRMIFLINVPLGLFALIVGARTLPARVSRPGRTRLDGVGTVLAAAGVFLLVFPLVQGRELGWPAWTAVMLVASGATLTAFVLHQIRRTRAGRTPLVELTVLARRSYSAGLVFVIVFFGALVGLTLAIGMVLQLGLGYSAMKASLTMSAWALGAFLGSGFGSAMIVKLGRRIVHIGLSIMTVSLAGLYVVMHLAGVSIDGWHLAVPLLFFGVGMGMIFVPLFDIIMGGVRDHEVGSAAGILESIQQLGASLGIAVLGTVFFGAIGAHTAMHRASVTAAAERVALLTLALTVVAFLIAFLLPRKARQAH